MSFDSLTHENIRSVNMEAAGNTVGVVAFYDPATGAICSVHGGPVSSVLLTHETNGLPFLSVPGADSVSYDTHYVAGGQVVLRPALLVEFAGGVLSGVPAGARLVVDGITYQADGSPIEITTDPDQQLAITVEQWPFRTVEVNV